MKYKINHTELPAKALAEMPEEPRSYVDEFEFFRLENGDIEAWYASEFLCTWNAKAESWS